jgi:predicted acylesterase/phospholipase RssA
VSIVVTYSARGSQGGKAHALVLNHITSPNVYIWSAVKSSCSLPGLMKPQPLMAKGPKDESVEFYPSESHFIDGTLQADLPFSRLAELFSITRFIVSQTNPHVRSLPLLFACCVVVCGWMP